VKDGEDTDDLWEIAEKLADAARTETLAHFRTIGLASESKGERYDPVTVADRGAEAAMRALIRRHRPDDAILGEELGHEAGISGLTWILDPIDGTRGFVSGTPTWGVLIGLSDNRGPFLGIIDQPYIAERFCGGPGRAWVDGPHGRQALQTRPHRPLSEATVFTTFPEVGTSAEARAFHAVAGRARLTRYGMDCYAYALVAAGHADLVIEAGLHPFDVAAPIAVIEAAGGMVTDWTGAPAHDGGRILAAANPEIHAEALAILRATAD
jgi:myo-inositol-1(or 4)-monophosphatase